MFPKSFKKLIDHFASLPSVGPKMAERLVLYLFKQDKEKLEDFGNALAQLKTDLRYCANCGNISEGNLCAICQDGSRDREKICVVEDPLDIIAIEKTKKYSGLYFVLGGTLGAIKNANNSQLKIKELEEKIKKPASPAGGGKIAEIILALNPTTEGDATALYLTKNLKNYNITITRLARGLSTGGDIEYADELTLSSAILNRK